MCCHQEEKGGVGLGPEEAGFTLLILILILILMKSSLYSVFKHWHYIFQDFILAQRITADIRVQEEQQTRCVVELVFT